LALVVAFNSFHAESQERNNVPVAAACRLIACILHNPNLTMLYLDREPSACVGHAAWQGEGLPVPPSQVAAEGWTAVLRWLRVRRVFARNLQLSRAQLTPSPRPAHSSTTA
jgi:hypothetical protein